MPILINLLEYSVKCAVYFETMGRYGSISATATPEAARDETRTARIPAYQAVNSEQTLEQLQESYQKLRLLTAASQKICWEYLGYWPCRFALPDGICAKALSGASRTQCPKASPIDLPDHMNTFSCCQRISATTMTMKQSRSHP